MMNPQPEPRRHTGRTVAVSLAAVLLAGLLAYTVGRDSGSDAPALLPDPGRRISWTSAGGFPVPESTSHGPTQTTNGMAAGFSHDELGAALAAINISYRLTSDVGPMVYETTARQQCYGDITTTIAQIRSQPSITSPKVTEFYYKILSGDPEGDLVLIAIAGKSASTTAAGGYASALRTLRWTGRDWQMQVPVAPAQITTDVSGYEFLGSPDV